MADSKISNLTEVTGPVAGDYLAVVDGGSTKKVSILNVLALSRWTLINSKVFAGDTTWDTIGLAGYNEVRILIKGGTLSSSGVYQARASIDNGATFLASSGDYLGISGTTGVETNAAQMQFWNTAATAARTGELLIEGINLTGPKWGRGMFFSVDSVGLWCIPTANAITAVRVLPSAGNMNGGTGYVFAR